MGVGSREPLLGVTGCSMRWTSVGLDEGVVDALGLEPGEEEVAEAVWGDGWVMLAAVA
jgi:hypothetical protein